MNIVTGEFGTTPSGSLEFLHIGDLDLATCANCSTYTNTFSRQLLIKEFEPATL